MFNWRTHKVWEIQCNTWNICIQDNQWSYSLQFTQDMFMYVYFGFCPLFSLSNPKGYGMAADTLLKQTTVNAENLELILFSFQAHSCIKKSCWKSPARAMGADYQPRFQCPGLQEQYFTQAPSPAMYILTKRIPDGVGNLLACHLNQSLWYYL